MKDVIVEKFNGEKIYTFLWNDKPCWIAMQVTRVLKYDNSSKAINNCIKAEGFELGVEYEVITGDELKIFKENISSEIERLIRYFPKLILFFEKGLYGFLQYTEKPVGVAFRTWIRREIIPQVRLKGEYTIEDVKENLVSKAGILDNRNKDFIKNKNFSMDFINTKEKLEIFRLASENIVIFSELMKSMPIDDDDKFLFLVSLYREAGIELDLGFINSRNRF
ncbi:BRO family protein [Clostridium tarantellae]|nr:BRO family protein [Clostridium tarantellae]